MHATVELLREHAQGMHPFMRARPNRRASLAQVALGYMIYVAVLFRQRQALHGAAERKTFETTPHADQIIFIQFEYERLISVCAGPCPAPPLARFLACHLCRVLSVLSDADKSCTCVC